MISGPEPGTGSRPEDRLSNGLLVRGGAGGVGAHLEDLERCAELLRRVAGELAGQGRAVAATALDPALALTAGFSPLSYARAESVLTCAAFGPEGLLGLAGRAEALGSGLAVVAAAYRDVDAGVAAGLRTAEVLAGRVAGACLMDLFGPGLVPAAAGLLAAVLAHGAAGEAPVHVPGVLRWGGGLALSVLAEHADQLEALAPGLPGFVGGAVGALPGGPLIATALFGRPAGPVTFGQVATGIESVAVPAGAVSGEPWLRESDDVQVSSRQVPWTAAGDVAALVGRIGSAHVAVPVVHVERMDGADGVRRWSVAIPGTATWSVRAGRTPFDLTGDVRLMAGERTAAMTGVIAAMRQAGVRRGEPVLLMGHSQGGLIAGSLAADPAFRREFTVTNVLTLGAPIAAIRIPDRVQVLAIEHSEDLVPRLDGGLNPDRPNWVTVVAPTPLEPGSGSSGRPTADHPLAAHRLELYQSTASVIDRTADPSLALARRSLAGFAADPQTAGTAWDFEITRAGTS